MDTAPRRRVASGGSRLDTWATRRLPLTPQSAHDAGRDARGDEPHARPGSRRQSTVCARLAWESSGMGAFVRPPPASCITAADGPCFPASGAHYGPGDCGWLRRGAPASAAGQPVRVRACRAPLRRMRRVGGRRGGQEAIAAGPGALRAAQTNHRRDAGPHGQSHALRARSAIQVTRASDAPPSITTSPLGHRARRQVDDHADPLARRAVARPYRLQRRARGRRQRLRAARAAFDHHDRLQPSASRPSSRAARPCDTNIRPAC